VGPITHEHFEKAVVATSEVKQPIIEKDILQKEVIVEGTSHLHTGGLQKEVLLTQEKLAGTHLSGG
jgi:hypothetical protein